MSDQDTATTGVATEATATADAATEAATTKTGSGPSIGAGTLFDYLAAAREEARREDASAAGEEADEASTAEQASRPALQLVTVDEPVRSD